MQLPRATLNTATKPTRATTPQAQAASIIGATFLGRPNRVGTQRADRILAVPWTVGSTERF